MKKILIIDYDQNSLATLKGVFAGQGYQVVTAADGQTGWDKYNKECPDLVLMEAMLPKVHGFELCQRITSERNSQAVVFIMTGVYKDRVYRTEALRTYGASEYFEKPLKMAELLASVEAVLGRPEPPRPETRPDVEPQPEAAFKPAEEIHPGAPPPAEHRKRDRAASDDSIFALPEDLDRLSREIPKVRKPAPRSEPSPEARLESLTDDLLKSVLAESTAPKTVQPRPGGGNGNGNGNGKAGAEIDQFLKSALAGLDLKKEKVKVPKTAPLPTPPVKVAPVPTPPPTPTPSPTPPSAPAAETKPIARPAPRLDSLFSTPPEKDMKSILTPGDPGSDVSPFFTPEKPKPGPAVERPRIHPAPVPPPTPMTPPRRPDPAGTPEKKVQAEAVRPEPVRREQPRPEPVRPEPVRHESVRPEPVRHEPARREPVKPEPVHPEQKAREAAALAAADIFQGIVEPREKKGFRVVAAVGIGVVAIAAVGFILLRPKPAATKVESRPSAVETVREAAPPVSEPVAEVPPPEIKPAPVKPKPRPKSADPGPAGADAILPAGSGAAAVPLAGTSQGPGNDLTAPGTKPLQADPTAQRTEGAAPPAAETKTAAGPGQAAAADAGAAATGQPPAAEPPTVSMPESAPVKEGDLVELSSVTEPPKLIKSVEPVYPPSAQRLGVAGSITVNALIDEKGSVIDTGILKGIQDDKGLGRAAQNAVRKWKFQPARKNGVPVKVWKSFIIAFKAEANPANTME